MRPIPRRSIAIAVRPAGVFGRLEVPSIFMMYWSSAMLTSDHLIVLMKSLPANLMAKLLSFSYASRAQWTICAEISRMKSS